MARPSSTLSVAVALVVAIVPSWAFSASKPPALPASATGAHARPQYGPLDAEETSQIQAISRAVLAAKHQQQPSPEEQALVTELHGLSADLDQATQLYSTPNIVVTNNKQPAVPQQAPSAAASTDRIRRSLESRLSLLDQRRQALLARAHGKSVASANNGESTRLVFLSNQTADLEQSVKAALALPDAKRLSELATLRDRLRPKTLTEMQHEQMLASGSTWSSPEPTITTIVRHRKAGGGARAGQP